MLDLDAPPHCCPFNVYTKNDHERERRKEERRREARTAAAAAQAAEEAARAAEAAEMDEGDAENFAEHSSSSAAANETQPATRERSVQVRVLVFRPIFYS